jgi:hypothetical protein
MWVHRAGMKNSKAGTSTLGIEKQVDARGASSRRVSCRQIQVDDIETILDLLCEGFTSPLRRHWAAALETMGTRAIPCGAPRYGYVIESDGRAVGVLLVITTQLRHDVTTTIRSNGSGWYVRPGFRVCAPLLLSQWLRSPADTFLNLWPAYYTRSLIEARGFVRFSNGTAVLFPAVTLRSERIRILEAARLTEAELPIPSSDRTLLVDHSRAGCIALWCEDRHRGYPFIFRRRLIKSWWPCAQLIYCRDLEDLSYVAGPIGRHLLCLGLPVVLAGTNGPIPGVPGIYIDGWHPMYFRGQTPPRFGDLTYTEAGLFGL